MRNHVYALFFLLMLFFYFCLVGCGTSSSGTATLQSVLISPSSVTVTLNSTRQFSALGLYSDNSVKSISPTWGVIGTYGTIGATSGLFYAGSSTGTCEILATYEAITGRATATVSTSASSQVVATIEVTPSSYSGRVGQSRAFTAVGKNSSGETVSMTPVWSVEGAIGTVTQTGTFSATAEGTGYVKCTSGEVSRSAAITISGRYLLVTCDADTYVDSSYPTSEYSTSSELNVSFTASSSRYRDSYISFDVSSIPSTAEISTATLSLYVASASLKSYILKKINNSWTPTMTYNSRPSTSGYTYVTSLDNPTVSAYNSVSIKDLVSGWVTTPSSNKGIFIYKPDSDDGGMVFLSKESSYKPYLEITY